MLGVVSRVLTDSMSERPKGRVNVRVGGVVDGEQHFVVSARDLTDHFSSAAITADDLREHVAKCERLLAECGED